MRIKVANKARPNGATQTLMRITQIKSYPSQINKMYYFIRNGGVRSTSNVLRSHKNDDATSVREKHTEPEL